MAILCRKFSATNAQPLAARPGMLQLVSLIVRQIEFGAVACICKYNRICPRHCVCNHGPPAAECRSLLGSRIDSHHRREDYRFLLFAV